MLFVVGAALSLGLAVTPRPASAASLLRVAAAATPSITLIADAEPAASPPSDLPTIEVKPRPVHTVPDYTPLPPPVTLQGRDPAGASETLARAAPPPAPKQTPAIIIAGAAHPDGGVTLSVRGRVVPLYGVRAPKPGDRCAVAPGPSPRACADVARHALAIRLSINANVSCRIPPGRRGGGSAAVCLDSTGVDLAGFLVSSGFVLADPAQGSDYVGAESIARSFRRGLWRYR